MSTFSGTKFRPTGRTYTTTNRYGETVIRDEFIPTANYKKWLDEQRKIKQQEELSQLKSKLDYQFNQYGEVDQVDFDEYRYKLKLYCGIAI